jgi:hypothetical protein
MNDMIMHSETARTREEAVVAQFNYHLGFDLQILNAKEN